MDKEKESSFWTWVRDLGKRPQTQSPNALCYEEAALGGGKTLPPSVFLFKARLGIAGQL